MICKLRDELIATPPKLSLSSFPSYHKPLPPTPGALTPPLQPMLAIPFEWEEEPGRPKPITKSKPKSFRCLELPPRLLVETNGPCSPTTVLDGPKVGRTLSHRFFLEDISPNSLMVDGPGLSDGPDKRKSESELGSYVGPCRWASCHDTKWDETGYRPNDDFPNLWGKSSSLRCDDVDVELKMTRFRRRSKGSLYKLSHKSSRFIENICQSLKRMVVRGRKEAKQRNRST